MRKIEENEAREDRIYMEAIVDAYRPVEKATGWYYYLDDKIEFPFDAICIKPIGKSPLKEGEKVTVLEMTEESDLSGIYVKIKWNNRSLAVPLDQLKPA